MNDDNKSINMGVDTTFSTKCCVISKKKYFNTNNLEDKHKINHLKICLNLSFFFVIIDITITSLIIIFEQLKKF